MSDAVTSADAFVAVLAENARLKRALAESMTEVERLMDENRGSLEQVRDALAICRSLLTRATKAEEKLERAERRLAR